MFRVLLALVFVGGTAVAGQFSVRAGQCFTVVAGPTLAPQCVCQGPTDPKCPCGKACQCVPLVPKPAVSVVKPPLPVVTPSKAGVTCVNGQCFPQIAPKAIVAKPSTPATKSVALPQCSCANCRAAAQKYALPRYTK